LPFIIVLLKVKVARQRATFCKFFRGEVFLCGSLLNSPAVPATDGGAILAGGLLAFRLHVYHSKNDVIRARPKTIF
jgi:hypothetical protein